MEIEIKNRAKLKRIFEDNNWNEEDYIKYMYKKGYELKFVDNGKLYFIKLTPLNN